MPNPGSAVQSFQPELRQAPAGVTSLHQRAVVTGAEAKLSSFLSGGVWPHGTDVPFVYPHGVMIVPESGTNACYITFDGTTASATLGYPIPSTGGYFEIPKQIAADTVHILSAGTSNLQLTFYF